MNLVNNLQVGRAALCRSVPSYDLPEGLPENTPARVVALGTHTVTVEVKDGRRWELLRILVYCGRDYRIKGTMYSRHHPQVIANLERMVRDVEEGGGGKPLNPTTETSLQSLREQLQEAKKLS